MEQHNVLEVAKQIETTSFLWEKSGVQRPKWPWETPPAPHSGRGDRGNCRV